MNTLEFALMQTESTKDNNGEAVSKLVGYKALPLGIDSYIKSFQLKSEVLFHAEFT